MFDQLKNLKQLAGLMGNAEELKARFEAVQAALEHKTAEAEAGAGAVRVTVSGHLRVTAVRIDPAATAALVGGGSDTDHAMIEQLIEDATNAAYQKALTMIKEEITGATGGLDLAGLPGLDKLLGK